MEARPGLTFEARRRSRRRRTRAQICAARTTDGIAERNRGAPVDSGSNDQQTMVNEIVDVIATEGMIPRENLQDDATIESLGLKSIDIVMISDRHRGKIRRLYPDGRLFPGGQGPQGAGRCDQRPYPQGKSRQMNARRVVVTGMGAVSSAGLGAEPLWRAARDGKPCVGPLDGAPALWRPHQEFPPRCATSTSRRCSARKSRPSPTLHGLCARRRRRGHGAGRARPRRAPGIALRRAARHRRRRHAHHRRRHLQRLFRQQAARRADRAAPHSERRTDADVDALWRHRPLFRGGQRLLLRQPGHRPRHAR